MSTVDTVVLGIIALALCVLVYSDYNHQKKVETEIQARRQLVEQLENERKKVFEDYSKDLASEETKSVWHQMYCASNAQIRLQNIIVQQNEVLMIPVAY